MSADYWLEVDTGGSEPVTVSETFSVTYNLGPMLRAAGFPSWKELVGVPVSDAAVLLAGVGETLRSERERLATEYAPANGWGSWQWAVDFVETFRSACSDNPKAIVGGWL